MPNANASSKLFTDHDATYNSLGKTDKCKLLLDKFTVRPMVEYLSSDFIYLEIYYLSSDMDIHQVTAHTILILI